MSISRKLILVFTLIALIPLGVFIYFYSITAEKEASKQLYSQLDLLALLQEERVNGMLESSKSYLAAVKTDRNIIVKSTSGKDPDLSAYLSTLREKLSDLRSISVLSSKGIVIASSHPDFINRDLSTEKFFRTKDERFDISNNYNSGDDRLSALLITPLHTNNIQDALIVAEADLTIRSSLTNYSGFGNTADSYLIKKSDDGRILLTQVPFGSKATLRRFIELEHAAAGSAIRNAISGGDAAVSDLFDHNGKKVISSFKPISGTEWTLIVNVPEEEALASINILRSVLWNIVFLSVTIVSLIAIVVARSITKPIISFEKAARQIAEGNLAGRVISESADEIGRLADTFNKMSEKLAESYAKLEERVAEKTKELSKKNRQLEREVERRTQTEEKLAAYASEVSDKNRALESSNAELDDFAYIASHDLKEPLRGIHNYSGALIEDYADKLNEDGREKLTRMMVLTQRLEELINALLYYSRVGRVDLAVEEVGLADIINDVVESVHVSLKEKNVRLIIADNLPVLKCDRVRVRELFHNLITNALKYNDKPEPTVEIGMRLVQRTKLPANGIDTPIYVFFVRDNGIGIKEKHFDSIFKIFKRLHGRDKFGGGTGAGLTIVKKIVEKHGGRVWVESTYGTGTTFFFTLEKFEHEHTDGTVALDCRG